MSLKQLYFTGWPALTRSRKVAVTAYLGRSRFSNDINFLARVMERGHKIERIGDLTKYVRSPNMFTIKQYIFSLFIKINFNTGRLRSFFFID